MAAAPPRGAARPPCRRETLLYLLDVLVLQVAMFVALVTFAAQLDLGCVWVVQLPGELAVFVELQNMWPMFRDPLWRRRVPAPEPDAPGPAAQRPGLARGCRLLDGEDYFLLLGFLASSGGEDLISVGAFHVEVWSVRASAALLAIEVFRFLVSALGLPVGVCINAEVTEVGFLLEFLVSGAGGRGSRGVRLWRPPP